VRGQAGRPGHRRRGQGAQNDDGKPEDRGRRFRHVDRQLGIVRLAAGRLHGRAEGAGQGGEGRHNTYRESAARRSREEESAEKGSHSMSRRSSILLWLAALAIAASGPAAAQSGPAKDSLKGKKLIEWGWDEPDTKFMRENVEKMEQFPFDGLVFHATSGKGDNLAWEVWGSKRFTPDDFQQAVADLKATKFSRFTDRFLRVNVTPAKVDWFDDDAWACVVNNFGVAAQVAREGRCKGFMFDTEQYEGVTVFDYRKQKDRDKNTFADYQATVPQRALH